MQKIENLSKVELEELLKNLRLYKDLVKKVWKRWEKIFSKLFEWKNEYLVEYYWNLDESYVLKESKEIYKRIFEADVKDAEIKIKQNQKIKWGMKIYLNDDLVDLSFLKFYNLLKK